MTTTSPLDLPAAPLLEQYGEEARLCSCANDQLTLVFSRRHPFDLVERIARHHRLRRLRCPLVTSNRRWQKQGVISRAWCNWRLRQRWHQGIAADQLARDYDR